MFELFKAPIVIKELRRMVVSLQHDVDILSSDVVASKTYRGNPYPSSSSAVTAIAEKYDGTAEWGNQQMRNIIDIRSAFIMGQGLKLSVENEADKKSREYQYLEEFVKFNNLNEELPQDLAKEAEVEGRCLVRLIPDPEKKQIAIRFISYSANNYKITTRDNDYLKYDKATYMSEGKEVVLEANEFVYKRFAGRVDKVNDVMPKCGMVLRHVEDLDKALVDWRKINHLFAAPTPYFKCGTEQEASKLQAFLEKIKWNIGKALCGTAEFSLVGMTDGGKDSIEKEIITLCKIISGATGVPVHFLGLPDLMSNRAVSTDLFEFINASTNKERLMWAGFYEELFDKVLRMAGTISGNGGLQEGKVKATVAAVTEAKIRELVEVWLPLYRENVIDLDFFLSKIPDVNPKKVKQAQKEAAQRIVDEMAAREESAARLKQDTEGQ